MTTHAPIKCPEPLVPAQAGHVELALPKTLWLYVLLAASALTLWFPPSAGALIAAFLLFAITLCAGHSVGLHRGIIHKSYRTSRFMRGLLAYLFVHTGIGGPISWIRLHHVRDYYQNARVCPRYFAYQHSLVRDFFWNLHLRFVPRDSALYGVPRDDEEDPWLRFLERTWPLHVLALGVGVWWLFGLATALTVVGARAALSVLAHWFVGFLAHKYGYVRYTLDGSPEIGRNLLVLGALSFGEGFHNNHHANPGSARMGEAWYEFDLGYLLVCLFERLGLVTDVQRSGRDQGVVRANAERVSPHWLGAAQTVRQ